MKVRSIYIIRNLTPQCEEIIILELIRDTIMVPVQKYSTVQFTIPISQLPSTYG